MIIHRASYGGVDCTNQIQARVKNNRLIVLADNSNVGHKKKLILNIENNTNTIDVWISKHQNIHINHGNHFTSHFTIYDQSKNLPQIHPYWGNADSYKSLL